MQQDLKIPANYFELVAKNQENSHLAQTDQYGYELAVEINALFDNEEEIKQESSELADFFSPEFFPPTDNRVNEYDLGNINDFSKILKFGYDGGGCHFCMDFSQNENEPRVIYWDDFDLRWRVIADNLEHFFALFKD